MFTWAVVLLLSLAGSGEAACSVTNTAQGIWTVYNTTDGENFTEMYGVQITSTLMLGHTHEKMRGRGILTEDLTYECYTSSGYEVAWKSTTSTTLFELFDVNIYFCWYMRQVDSNTYNIKELTSEVSADWQEYGVAILTADSNPAHGDICQTRVSSVQAPYKQLRKIVMPTWNTGK